MIMNSIHLNFLGSAPDSVIERVKFIDADHITGSLGQIKYTSLNYTGFSSLTIKFRALTTGL